jgi:hypothetical protein
LVTIFPDIFPALTKRDSKVFLASFRRRYLLLFHRGKVSESLYFVLHFHDEMLVGVMHGLCAGIIELEVLISWAPFEYASPFYLFLMADATF